MTAEEALAILDEVLQQEHLSDVQEIVFRHCWDGQTYAAIAENAGYDTGYIKDVGSKLWQFLSGAFGEKVTKNNVQAVLRRYQQSAEGREVKEPEQAEEPETVENAAEVSIPHSTAAQSDSSSLMPAASQPHTDWGDAIDVSTFYGRTEELEKLTHWLITDRCRVVSLLGMGGIGKTSLSVKLAQQLAFSTAVPSFQFVIWRSLRNAPPAEEMLADWIRFLSQEQETELPADLNGRLTRLIYYLRLTHCLLVLDNAETILRSGEYSGYFRTEYEGYGEIFKRLAELPHQSCLLITSRENPRPLTVLEGETLPVRALRLSGISEAEARKILQAKGAFSGADTEWQELTTRYGGNPLALKVVATTIQELFDGDIAAFLAEGTTVFDDIRYLLGQQFDRLSSLEQAIMYWLAISREPMLIAELQEDLIPAVSKSKLIEAIGILRWRSLIDKTINHYTQQPVIMEYIVERLIEQVSQEIMNEELFLFIRHALIKAPVKDYVRDSQIRVILQPLIERLCEESSQQALEHQLGQLLLNLRESHRTNAGYAGGNLLNLFRQLGTDLTGADFSGLAISHAYLQDVALHQVNFSQAQISKSVFAQRLGSILSVAFSPDGKLLASSDADGEICLWQVVDGKQLLICKEEQNQWVWSVCFSPDSKILASSSEDQTIKLWDTNTGECLQELIGHTHWTFSVAFHPNGEYVASSSEDQTIKLWDISTGECLSTLSGHTSGVRSIAFSPDGQWLASASSDQTVRLWQMDTGTCRHILTGHDSIVRSVVFSPDQRWLASCSDDQTIRLWSLETGNCERIFACESRPWSVAFSPDSQFLLTGSDDQRLRLWEIHTQEPIRSFEGHTGLVLAVTFSPNGQTAVSGSDDQTIKFWEVDTGRCLKTVRGHNNWVWSVDFSPKGQQLASGHEDHTVRLWQVDTGRCTHVLEGHSGRVWSVAYSPQGQILASGSDDQTIRFWQVEAPVTQPKPARSVPIGRCIKTLRGQTGAVRLVVFSPDGLILASNSGDHTVKLWDVSPMYAEKPERAQLGRITAGRSGEWVSGQCLAVLEGTERVSAISFSPDQQRIATGSGDGTIYFWDTQLGTRLNRLEGHTKPVETIDFSPSGELLASGSDDGTVRLWDSSTGKCLSVIQPEVGRVLTLAFSIEAMLAIGGSHPVSVLWDVITGELFNRLEGHTKTVQTLAFSPDGRILATGSEDETIRLWTQQQFDKLLRVDRPYEGLNLTDVRGLTAAQKATLKLLGAVED